MTMARIRTIKPELASDIGLAQLSIQARYTFVLIITQADDYGLLAGAPRQLLGALYPHDDDVTAALLGGWIDELVNAGLAQYLSTADGARVIQVVNWAKHQRIDNAAKSPLLASLGREPGDPIGVPTAAAAESADVRGESRRVAAKSRSRALDLGPRTKDQPTTTPEPIATRKPNGNGKERSSPSPGAAAPAGKRKTKQPPQPREPKPLWDTFCAAWHLPQDGGRHKGLAGEFDRDCSAAGASVDQFAAFVEGAKADGSWGTFVQVHNTTARFLAWRDTHASCAPSRALRF